MTTNNVEQHGKRILFASCHGHVDPSSGAAVSVRKLLTQLAGREEWCVETHPTLIAGAVRQGSSAGNEKCYITEK